MAVTGVAVWRSGTLSRPGSAGLLLAGLVGVPSFLDVIVLQYLSPLLLAAGPVIVGASLWRASGRRRADD